MALNKFAGRKLEWCMALYSTAFGVFLLFPADSMGLIFNDIISVLSEFTWGVLYALTGAIHVIALQINGRASWTPYTRLAAIFVSSQVFLACGLSMWDTAPWRTGGFTYTFLALVFCGPCVWTAAKDVGDELKIRERQRHGDAD